MNSMWLVVVLYTNEDGVESAIFEQVGSDPTMRVTSLEIAHWAKENGALVGLNWHFIAAVPWPEKAGNDAEAAGRIWYEASGFG